MKKTAAGSVAAASVISVATPPAGSRSAEASTRPRFPVVGIAASDDSALKRPAPLDTKLTTEQISDIVWLALDRDTSDRNLRSIVKKESWVVVKPNIVTCPVTMNDFHAEDLEHWWLVTDLRVVRAVVEYLVEKIGPRRITIAEGPPWFTSGGRLKNEEFIDGWHAKWREFGNLSYTGVAEELSARRPETTVDIVDLNEDVPVHVTNFDPRGSGIGALQEVRPKDPESSSDTEWTVRKGIWYPRTVVDCDVLITMPVLKTHSSAGVTLGVKNLVGCIHSQKYGAGNSKSPIHQGSQLGLVRGIADLGATLDPDYTVAEGFWATIQQHLGQNGVGINHNVVVAGGDVVATEAISMMVMGYHPLDSDLLRLLNRKKIGQWHPDTIAVKGPPVKSVRMNYPRAANTYFARGIRKWRMIGPFSDALADETVKNLDPTEFAPIEDREWEMLDGDDLIDVTSNVNPPYRLRDCLLYPIPGSKMAQKNSRYYLTLAVNTERRDLCGQLLVGLKGGDLRVFLNGSEIPYPAEVYPYDPTPMPFLKFLKGRNLLVVEITKRNGTEDITIAANICDLDGDRLTDFTADPVGESSEM